MERVLEFLSSHPFSDATKRTYLGVLARFRQENVDASGLNAWGLLYWIGEQGDWGNSRQCVALACIKKYLGWLYGASHPALGARIKRVRGKVPRCLDRETVSVLLALFDRHDPKGARDLALCSLALDTGLRASELCRLQQGDTDTEMRKLQVLVKGGAWEWAVFSPQTAAHIEHWKQFRARLNPRGHLFVHIKTGEGLTSAGLYSIVGAWGDRIGIKLSPHDFRRTFATISSENGAPDRVIMEGGRWKSTQMVTRYTRSLRLEAMRRWLPMSNLKDE